MGGVLKVFMQIPNGDLDLLSPEILSWDNKEDATRTEKV